MIPIIVLEIEEVEDLLELQVVDEEESTQLNTGDEYE